MSYQVIARKWRPQTFEEVTGQEVITRTLRNSLEFDRVHHAYMFSGARGVGKTTTARILAKALNCHKTDRPNLTPCLPDDADACPSCIEIAESRSMDVLEIDAASHTGIGEVRETILDNINFNPARDRFRVFIIDEVHQLSKPAFNALLKTIEEPPPNVVFVMATTELHKVPETILSRCQEFQFRTIPLAKIFDRLKLIAEAEKIDITDEALRELARSGEGSMRDAQSNFDQVISFSGDKITAADVTNALGLASVEVLTKTLNSVSDRDAKLALAVVDDLIAGGHDLRNFCRDLLGLFRDLLVFKVSRGDAALLEGAVLDEAEMRALAEPFTEADLLRFFNSLAETEASLREAMHPRYVLEMGLVKLIEMRSVSTLESILARLESLASAAPLPTAKSAATAAAESSVEKKTLKSELAVDLRLPHVTADISHREIEPEPVFAEPRFPAKPVERFEPPIIRLPSLSAEELEHIDDPRLDDAYEAKLANTGDNLMPFDSISELVDALLGDTRAAKSPAAPFVTPGNGTSAATAPAFDVYEFKHETGAVSEEPVEMPALSAEPTNEELLEYAKAHPAVRAAMRTFRAKIVEVKRT